MKTGKNHYIKNYNFHEILTCLSHGYKNIGQNNILSLIKIYFNEMWTIILFIINQRYNHYISSCIPWELFWNGIDCCESLFFVWKIFYHDIWSLPNFSFIYPSPTHRWSRKTILMKGRLKALSFESRSQSYSHYSDSSLPFFSVLIAQPSAI